MPPRNAQTKAKERPAATAATRIRRSPDQLIQDLEAKIAQIKTRAARRRAQANPATRFTSQALKSIDKALSLSEDATTKKALHEARATLAACLALDGTIVSQGSRAKAVNVEPEMLLQYVTNNPGQRGEEIAAALGTDSRSVRPSMQKLISAKKVKTRGERRGIVHLPESHDTSS